MPSLECGEIDNEHENENDEEKIGSDRREFRFYQPTEKQTRTKDDDEKGFRNDAKQVQALRAWLLSGCPSGTKYIRPPRLCLS